LSVLDCFLLRHRTLQSVQSALPGCQVIS